SDFVGTVEVDDISVRKDITLFSSGAIIITVTDATTGLPLSDAEVVLHFPTTAITCLSFVSENGQYIFFAHEWGLEFPDVETEVFVTASMDGYGAQQVDFIWHPGKAEPLDFALYTAINAINTPEELASAEAGTCAVTGDNWDGALALNGTDDFEDGSVYVKIDGLHGYRILLPANGATEINAGDKIKFKGIVREDENGKYLEAEELTAGDGEVSVRALGLTNGILDTNTLVLIWGRVASADNGSYVINNGFENITVFAEKTQMPNVGAFVIVTGIAAPNGVRAIEVL
ncbi:MAG: hypothetical protein J6U98_07955, partial [Abditibacteriota bacterium]|nr:hypothetical protein [Abditibacteriota bacterium]